MKSRPVFQYFKTLLLVLVVKERKESKGRVEILGIYNESF